MLLNKKKGTVLINEDINSKDLDDSFFNEFEEFERKTLHKTKSKMFYVVIALLLMTITWAVIAELPIVTIASGKVIPSGRIKTIQIPEMGIVVAINVYEGKFVKANELLFELDSAASVAEQESGREKLLLAKLEYARKQSELDGNIQYLNDVSASSKDKALEKEIFESSKSAFQAKVSEARLQLRTKQHLLNVELGKSKKIKAKLEIASEKESNAKPFVGQAISQFAYLALLDDLNNAKNDYETSLNQIEVTKNEIRLSEQSLDRIEKEHKTELMDSLHKSLQNLAILKAENIKAQRIVKLKQVRSPVSGYVQNINVHSIGAVISPSEPIATIIPSDTTLVVEANVANSEIGFVKVGQQVNIKVDAFPFQKYGIIPGVIDWISPDAERSDSKSIVANATDSRPGFFYRARIKIAKSEKDELVIVPGMSVQADIVTDKRRIISYFTSPITKNLSASLQLR